jgi:hypothetical protein
MQKDGRAESPHGDRQSEACDVRLASRISQPVDYRLRLLVLIERRPLSHVLTQLLDQVLPGADALLEQLRDSGPAPLHPEGIAS